MKFALLTPTVVIALAQATLGITEITHNPSGSSCGRPKCLDVRGAVLANGTPVQIYDCNGSKAQDWTFSRNAPTSVKLGNSTFCLDAGSSPGNGVGMKIWQCYDNLPAQTWFYTVDNRIALYNRGLCLDLTNGNFANGNQVQTWQCSSGNQNQEWFQINSC